MSNLLEQASLVMIPSGYKEDVVYSEIPINGAGDMSFTRASNGTRINSQGLVEVVPWNLVEYSEDFSNAFWTKQQSSITANATTAPNGTSTADKLVEDTSNSVHRMFNNGAVAISTSDGTTYSFYLKSAGRTRAWVRDNDIVGALFNLSNGTIVSTEGTATATITNVGDGWYRCTITKVSSGTSGRIVVYLDNGTSDSYTGNGTSGIFIWGAQLVEGTTAQTYFPTTDRLNVPRLSYMYGSCPSVLLEPQRTNLALWSEDFSNASWGKVNTTITANVSATLDPSGGNNADKFIATTTNSTHNIGQTGFASTAYSFSVYAKAAEETSMSLWLRGNTVRAEFNLSNGTISNITVTSATITSVGNGWYRCTVYDSTPGTTATIYGRGGGTYAGNGTDGFYLYGAQLEAGAYPTTYISTTSATATRVADSFSRNNIYTNGLITSSGGTWFVELRNNVAYTRDAGANGLALSTDSGVTTNAFFLRAPFGSSRIGVAKYVSGTFSEIYTTTTTTTKIAIKWNGTTADIFANGTKVVSATSFTATTLEFLNGNAADVPKFIQQMALYPSPLSDTDCTTLTTL